VGDVYPWAALTGLQAPKFFSDIVESLIGAIYIDSMGNMDEVKNAMERLGILTMLRRVVEDGFDVRHPVSRVAMWVSQQYRNAKQTPLYDFSREKGLVTCNLIIAGDIKATVTRRYNGRSSQEEVKFAAAEEFLKILSGEGRRS